MIHAVKTIKAKWFKISLVRYEAPISRLSARLSSTPGSLGSTDHYEPCKCKVRFNEVDRLRMWVVLQ